jgi:hypothetical protein
VGRRFLLRCALDLATKKLASLDGDYRRLSNFSLA